MNFEKALQSYLEHVKIWKSEGTYRHYSSHKTYPINILGKMKLKNINQKIIDQYILSQKERNPEIKNATINKHLKLIRQTYRHAMGKPLNISLLKEDKSIINTINNSVIEEIFDYYEKNLDKDYLVRNYVMVKILLDTGIRLSEMINVKISDINFEKNKIHLKHTKAKKERIVFFRNETKALILEYITKYNIESFLFINLKTRKQLHYDSISTIFIRLKKQFNINKSISPHKWRHTFATNFIRSKGSLEALRQIMGHEDLETTQKYLHLTSDDIMTEYNYVMNA